MTDRRRPADPMAPPRSSAAGLALAASLLPAGAAPVAAAADELSLTTSATYTLVPANHVVRVVLDVTARNNKPNAPSGGIITRYFYEGAASPSRPRRRTSGRRRAARG